MSRTMTIEAMLEDRSANMDRGPRITGPSIVLDHEREVVEQTSRAVRHHYSSTQPRALLDTHCDHTDMNADRTRCLGCGVWATEFGRIPQ